MSGETIAGGDAGAIDVSALIVNYNSGELAQALVETLATQDIRRADGSRGAMEIVVLDNASPADQRAFLKPLSARGVRVVYQPENSGYSGGVNAAVRVAKGRHLLILNPDVLVAPGTVQALLDHLRTHIEVGIAAPFGWLDPVRFWMLPPLTLPTLGAFLAEMIGHRSRVWAGRLARQRSRTTAAFWAARSPFGWTAASGYAFMMSAELARALGPFDEGYPLYFEDGDLCRRLRQAGRSIEVVPAAEMVHLYNQSAGQDEGLAAEKNLISTRRYFGKFYGRVAGLAAEAAVRLLRAPWPSGHWASPSPSLGRLSAPPTVPVPPPLSRWLAQLSPDPCFTWSAGHFGEGDRLEIPEEAWHCLPQAALYLRLVDPTTFRAVATYACEKTTPSRVDYAPAAWRAATARQAAAREAARSWTIREYSPGDEDRIVPLFNRVFGASSTAFVPRHLDFWKWQFERNPAGHHAFVAEDRDGQLIGNYAGIRTPFLCRGRRRVGSQVVDICVGPDYEHTGLVIDLGRSFITHFGRPDADFVLFGYPNPPSLRVGSRHLAYRPVHCPVFKFRLEATPRWIERMSAASARITVAEADGFDAEVDALWGRVAGEHQFTTWRDAAYLRWRYAEHPTIRYRVFTARGVGGEMRGLVVLREGWFGAPVVSLVDWLTPRRDAAVLAALLAAAGRVAQGLGVSRLETWVPPACPERENLQRFGFTEEETPFNLVMRSFDPEVSVDWARQHWFYTMGDTDFY